LPWSSFEEVHNMVCEEYGDSELPLFPKDPALASSTSLLSWLGLSSSQEATERARLQLTSYLNALLSQQRYERVRPVLQAVLSPTTSSSHGVVRHSPSSSSRASSGTSSSPSSSSALAEPTQRRPESPASATAAIARALVLVPALEAEVAARADGDTKAGTQVADQVAELRDIVRSFRASGLRHAEGVHELCTSAARVLATLDDGNAAEWAQDAGPGTATPGLAVVELERRCDSLSVRLAAIQQPPQGRRVVSIAREDYVVPDSHKRARLVEQVCALRDAAEDLRSGAVLDDSLSTRVLVVDQRITEMLQTLTGDGEGSADWSAQRVAALEAELYRLADEVEATRMATALDVPRAKRAQSAITALAKDATEFHRLMTKRAQAVAHDAYTKVRTADKGPVTEDVSRAAEASVAAAAAVAPIDSLIRRTEDLRDAVEQLRYLADKSFTGVRDSPESRRPPPSKSVEQRTDELFAL
jgi:hypothetical protein